MNAPLVQLVEDHKAVWGKHFTVSFWYKSNKETYYNIWNGTSQIHFLVPSSGGAWKKWEQTYKLKENGAYFRLEFYSHTIEMTSGSYLELAQVQIELGKVATPFEHRSYGEELALCQRYYQLNISNTAFTNSTTVARLGISGVVQMRAQPSLTIVDATGRVEDFGIANRNLVSLASFSPGGASGTMGGAVDATITSSSNQRSHILFAGSIGLDSEI
jgi:hypothetical protein